MKKTALVTGSSRGIGKAIALVLAKKGYRIILHGISQTPTLTNTEKEIKKTGNYLMTVVFDVIDQSEVSKIISKLNIDILVNNAGLSLDNTFMKMTDDKWDRVIKTNLYGPFYVTREVLPRMIMKRFGRIINISSIAAKGAYGKSNYAASKAGLIGMTKSVALEVAKHNITVNAVCPGYINAGMSAKIPQKVRKSFLSGIAANRAGEVSEVAQVVAFLASDESSYVTGSVIDVNGGWF